MHRRIAAATALGAALALGLGAVPSKAAEEASTEGGLGASWSAFGTVGWAQSNRDWSYQRFIDDQGSLKHDTLLGAQVDLQFAPRWSATLQARVAPSVESDSRWDVVPSWAFIAWRPTDDWLLRVGKLRVPLFLRSEHLEVGQTYDEAGLPPELYTLAPTNDFAGLHAARSWQVRGGELTADAYWGYAELTKRFWVRDGLPPQVPAGAAFEKVHTSIAGLVATLRKPGLSVRAGLHQVSTHPPSDRPMPVRPTLVPLGPGVSYWQTDNALPGPGLATVSRIHNVVLQLGADVELGQGWRVAGEIARIRQRDTELGSDALGGYVTLFRRLGPFTPYARVAALRTRDKAIDWSRTLETTVVPDAVPGAAMLNASMRLRADYLPVYDQESLAVGSSYALSPRSKLKFEWMRTRAGRSQMFDLPAGEPLHKSRSVDVLSVGVSFVY